MIDFLKKQLILVSLFTSNIFCAEISSSNIFKSTFKKGNQDVTENVILRKDIFKHFIGITETDFCSQFKHSQSMPSIRESSNILMSKLKHTNPTLQELRNATQAKLQSKSEQGKLSIINVDVVKYPDFRYLVDIGALQAAHPNALFQTASRTNGLEGVQISFQRNKQIFNPQQNGVMSIIGKFAVQGEEAAISTILRSFYEIYNMTEEINFFKNVGVKIDAKGNIIQVDTNHLQKNETSLSNDISIVHWQNVPVTTGYANVIYQNAGITRNQDFNAAARNANDTDANVILATPHYISQVNVAAVDLDTQRQSFKTLDLQAPDNKIKLAKAALRAAYEGTLLCAINENKKDVFLSLIGCGSFKNQLEWIADILEELTDLIKKSGLNVTLIALEVNANLHNNPSWKRIEGIVQKTNGKITTEQNLKTKKAITQLAAQKAATGKSTKKTPEKSVSVIPTPEQSATKEPEIKTKTISNVKSTSTDKKTTPWTRKQSSTEKQTPKQSEVKKTTPTFRQTIEQTFTSLWKGISSKLTASYNWFLNWWRGTQ